MLKGSRVRHGSPRNCGKKSLGYAMQKRLMSIDFCEGQKKAGWRVWKKHLPEQITGARSTMSTSFPQRASARATASPTTPAPITATSVENAGEILLSAIRFYPKRQWSYDVRLLPPALLLRPYASMADHIDTVFVMFGFAFLSDEKRFFVVLQRCNNNARNSGGNDSNPPIKFESSITICWKIRWKYVQ